MISNWWLVASLDIDLVNTEVNVQTSLQLLITIENLPIFFLSNG